MAEDTLISWADDTFNPWEGCQKVGPGCDNCYAETRNARYGGGVAANWGPGAPRRRTSASNWKKPLAWDREQAAKIANRHSASPPVSPRFVFCSSLADVFDNAVPHEWRRDLFDLIRATPNLTWLLLTKRPGNILKLFEEACRLNDNGTRWTSSLPDLRIMWPRNAAIGCTVVNQEEANRDIPKLRDAKRKLQPAFSFLSMEPLLGPVDLRVIDCGHFIFDALTGAELHRDPGPLTPVIPTRAVDWVIVGGESGPNARLSHPKWFRDPRDHCAAARVPFQFKQWGEWAPYTESGHLNRAISPEGMTRRDDGSSGFVGETWMSRVGKKAAGHLLDGAEHLARPEVR